LRLVAKWVSDPLLAIVGSLEFYFVAAAGHDCEQAILVCNAKRLKSGNGCCGEWNCAERYADEFRGGGICDPGKHDCRNSHADRVEIRGKPLLNRTSRGRFFA